MGVASKSLLAGVVGALTLSSAAMAADISLPPIIDYEPEYVEEIGKTWYLRGDLGYARYADFDAIYADGAVEFLEEDIEDTLSAGIGLGFVLNHYFRADVTLDHRFDTDVYMETETGGVCGGGPCVSKEYATLSSTVALANIYLEAGKYYGFAPYIGAGLGAARNNLSNWRSTTPATNVSERTDWSFAWALMAGVGYQVSDSLVFDLGYRYLDLGDIESGPDLADDRFNVELEDIHVHEARIGFRYLFH